MTRSDPTGPPPTSLPIRQGGVYWVDDVPAMSGGACKRRPVLVISSTSTNATGTIAVVGVSASMLELHEDRIRLPDTSDQPQSTSGLHEPSWTSPGWLLAMTRARLIAGTQVGYVGGPKLREIIAAVQAKLRSS